MESYEVWDPFRNVSNKPSISEVFQTKDPVADEINEVIFIECSQNTEGNLTPSAPPKGKEKASSALNKKSSDVLKESYGDIVIEIQDNKDEDVTVTLTVQGYYFEGVATTQVYV